ncbi:hypothetical protein MNBD_GAMMA15-1535, partial [hydrothermal vent metagenome]
MDYQPVTICLPIQAQKTDTNDFFNLLTSPEILDLVEAQLPEHRESKYPPTLTLSMFFKLFLQRWHVELDLRNIKTTLGMETLSCKTAEMCEKEMWVYFL